MAYVEEPPLSPEDPAMGEWPARRSGPRSAMRLAAAAATLLCVGLAGCGEDDPRFVGSEWHGPGTIWVNQGPLAEVFDRGCGFALPPGATTSYDLYFPDSPGDALLLHFQAAVGQQPWDATNSNGYYQAAVSGNSFDAGGTFASRCGKGTGTHRITGKRRGRDTLDATLEIILAGQQATISLSLTRVYRGWRLF